jgi:Tol biopolymer transport system component
MEEPKTTRAQLKFQAALEILKGEKIPRFVIFFILLLGAALLANLGCSLFTGNGLIALTLRDQNGKLQIFTIFPDGTEKRQLTFDGENGRPDWSPDGRKIAFMSIRDGKAWVAVMDPDGSNQKLLAEGLAPDWSPDGKQIAFSRPDDRGIMQIWVMNADGRQYQADYLQQYLQNSSILVSGWKRNGICNAPKSGLTK